MPDTEFATLAPDGVSTHAMRVRYGGVLGSGASVARARSFADPPHIDDGAALLADMSLGAIAYCFTSSSYALGPDGDAALKARLETKTKGIPVTLTCLAAVSALRAVGARRVALIHPPWFADDVFLLRHDPTRDIHNTRLIEAVYKEGHRFDPRALLSQLR